MEWVTRKKGLLEVMVRSMMRLYHGTKTKGRAGSKLCEEFLVQVVAHQGSVFSPLIFAIVMNVIIEYVKGALMNKLLNAGNKVFTSKRMEKLRMTFLKWKEA